MVSFFDRLFGIEEKDKTKYLESGDTRKFRENIHESAEGIHNFNISESPVIDPSTGTKITEPKVVSSIDSGQKTSFNLTSHDFGRLDGLVANASKKSELGEIEPSKDTLQLFAKEGTGMAIMPLIILFFVFISMFFSGFLGINIGSFFLPLIIITFLASFFKKNLKKM